MSRALGQKNFEKVSNISSFCFYGSLVVGVVGGAAILAFMEPILGAIGTTTGTAGFAREYLSIIAMGGPLIVVSTAFTNIIRGEGASKNSMIGMMVVTVVNIILDPIFILDEIFGIKLLGMGVKGAAIATLIGNAVSLAMFIAHILSKNSVLTLNIKRFKMGGGILAGVLVIGLPASLTNILMSVSAIATNKLLASYFNVEVVSESLIPLVTTFIEGKPVYGDIPVSAMGAALKANMLAIFVQLGLGMGIAPLIGYNYGARKKERIYRTIRYGVLYASCFTVLGLICFQLFPGLLLGIFNPSPTMLAIGVPALRRISISFLFAGFCIIAGSVCQALDKSLYSLFVSILRQVVALIPSAWLLAQTGNVDNVWWCFPIAEIVSLIASFFFLRSALRGMDRRLSEVVD